MTGWITQRTLKPQESNMDKNKHNELGEASRSQRQYRSPQVKTYGNIRDITQAVGHSGNDDGAGQRPKKTALP